MRRWFLLILFAAALSAQSVTLQVLSTTDTHGHILPENTGTLQPEAKGWAQLATLIRERKALNPNTLLVDSGDSLQGEPISYVRARLRRDLPDPVVAIMNALGYQAMAVGNHDLDWGFPALRQVEEQAQFPFLAANVLLSASGKGAFTSHVLVEVAGLKVAILGLSTARLTALTESSPLPELRVEDPVKVAQRLVPQLREQEKADLVLVIYHGGLGRVPSQAGEEHQALALAEVPGVDAVLSGHTHLAVAQRHKGIPVLQCPGNAKGLGCLELTLERQKGRWVVVKAEPRILQPSLDTPRDPQVLELTQSLRTETTRYLDTFVTNLGVDLDGRFCRMEDTALAQLLHAVQRQASGAQLSAISSPPARYYVPKGPTSVRQFWALMPYENRLVTIRVTGAQLKLYLEQAARYFRFSHEPELVNKEIPGYDFDLVDGVNYALDLSRAPGQRVLNLSFRGQAVKLDQSFTMAISSYRFSGGGGYLEAMGWSGEPLAISKASLRNLLLEYLLSRPGLNPAPVNNWRTIPALDRERVMQQVN